VDNADEHEGVKQQGNHRGNQTKQQTRALFSTITKVGLIYSTID
jgi:hypothetical protein